MKYQDATLLKHVPSILSVWCCCFWVVCCVFKLGRNSASRLKDLAKKIMFAQQLLLELCFEQLRKHKTLPTVYSGGTELKVFSKTEEINV